MGNTKKSEYKLSIDIDDTITKITTPSDVLNEAIKRISKIQKTINKFRIKRGLHSEEKTELKIVVRDFMLEVEVFFNKSKVNFYELFRRLTKNQFNTVPSSIPQSRYSDDVKNLLYIKALIEGFGSQIDNQLKLESIIGKVVCNDGLLTDQEITTAKNIIDKITSYEVKGDTIKKLEKGLDSAIESYNCDKNYINKIKINIFEKFKKNANFSSSINKSKEYLKKEIDTKEAQTKDYDDKLKTFYNLLLESQITTQDISDAIDAITNIRRIIKYSEEGANKNDTLKKLGGLSTFITSIKDEFKLTPENIKTLDNIFNKKQLKDNFTKKESEAIENVLDNISSLRIKYDSKVMKLKNKKSLDKTSKVIDYSSDMRKNLSNEISDDVLYVLVCEQYFSGTVGIKKIQKDVEKIEEYIIKHRLNISNFGQGIIPRIDSNIIQKPDGDYKEFIMNSQTNTNKTHIRYIDFISSELLDMKNDYEIACLKFKKFKDDMKKIQGNTALSGGLENCIQSLKINKNNLCEFEPKVNSLIKKYPKFTKILEHKFKKFFYTGSSCKAQLGDLINKYYQLTYDLKYGSCANPLKAINTNIDNWEKAIFEFTDIIKNYPKISNVKEKLEKVITQKEKHNHSEEINENYNKVQKYIKSSESSKSSSKKNSEENFKKISNKLHKFNIELSKYSEELNLQFEKFNELIRELEEKEKASYKAVQVFKIVSKIIFVVLAIMKGSVTLCAKGGKMNVDASALGKNMTKSYG